jgi:hypothetical protein
LTTGAKEFVTKYQTYLIKLAYDKQPSLFRPTASEEDEKSFMTLWPGANV